MRKSILEIIAIIAAFVVAAVIGLYFATLYVK
jgi:hypothetical protein